MNKGTAIVAAFLFTLVGAIGDVIAAEAAEKSKMPAGRSSSSIRSSLPLTPTTIRVDIPRGVSQETPARVPEASSRERARMYMAVATGPEYMVGGTLPAWITGSGEWRPRAGVGFYRVTAASEVRTASASVRVMREALYFKPELGVEWTPPGVGSDALRPFVSFAAMVGYAIESSSGATLAGGESDAVLGAARPGLGAEWTFSRSLGLGLRGGAYGEVPLLSSFRAAGEELNGKAEIVAFGGLSKEF